MKSFHFPTLHFPTLHFPTLHFPTLHFPTLHFPTLHFPTLHFPTLHFPTLHFPTLHFPTLHFPTLHFPTLHFPTLHFPTLHFPTLHFPTLHFPTLHFPTLHFPTLHFPTLHFPTLHFPTLHFPTLHFPTLHFPTLHFPTLHFPTLHFPTLHFPTLHFPTLHFPTLHFPTLHFPTLHFPTLHFPTLHFPTLHFPTLHFPTLHFPTLHFPTLHFPTLHFPTLHFPTLHFPTLHFPTLHFPTLHFPTLHFPTLHFPTLHFPTLHFPTLHFPTLHFPTLHFPTLHFPTLHFPTLHFPTLHFPTLHFPTLHFPTLHFPTLHFHFPVVIAVRYPVNPITNVLPLVLVLMVSLMKEAFEDRKRYNSDKVINSSITECLRGNQWIQTPWSAVRVGDILRVKSDQYFPADLLCLATTNGDGICYIETSNLDGETNLKIRKALERTWEYITADAAADLRAMVECEQPNNSLYTFTGNLVIGKQTLPISPNQMLLRGCSLRNTEWIVGAVIFTGHETKVMMNAMDVPSKRSTLERRMDLVILILFAILFTMCLIGAIASALFLNYDEWYLQLTDSQPQYDPSNPWAVGSLTFLTLFILYATIIPISLYVSIEMIKFVQSTQFINKDLHMFHRETQTPALARTSNLNEELGQVEYIFSDKTGTLTRNTMEFFKCSIGGTLYGTGVTEIQRAMALRMGQPIQEDPESMYQDRASQAEVSPLKPTGSDDPFKDRGFNFEDKRLLRGAWRNEPTAEICKEFFRLLAICHTVLPEGEESPEEIEYLAASPDEAAMVAAAKNFGFFFYRRTPTTIKVRESHVERLGRVADCEYEVLNVLEFNSMRKRQSVICRCPDGRIVLYCKGADVTIYERLSEDGNPHKDMTREHLEKFGADGLRTLCLAYRELPPALYEEWNERFIQAKSALREREKRLDEVAEMIERDLILLGCTAIEDKLQEGVPQCIETLQKAGIKIWILTGDKMETAINIAYACMLLKNQMKQFIISSETDIIREVEERGDPVDTARVIRESVFQQLRDAIRQAVVIDREGYPCALVIDGRCLMYALDPLMRGTLLQLGIICKAVVCCRVSPLQKAQVTALMRDGAGKVTLSIGDGANDVSMIQAAHVGVGISGQEGIQAVLASDFAIAQFRFLTDLLLVHGRLSYLRISKVVAYFFYKNLAFTLTLFWFNCFAGFSGQRLYDDWFQSAFNVLFTALPVIVLGLFEQDVDRRHSKLYPQLYRDGIKNRFFTWGVLGIWLFFAVYQSLIFFFFTAVPGSNSQGSSGLMFGLWDIGTMTYAAVIVAINVRLLMASDFLTKWHWVSVVVSIALWFVLILIYDAIPSSTTSSYSSQSNQYWVIYTVMGTAYFWLTLLLVPIAALLPDFLYIGLQRWFSPYDYQIVQEDLKFHSKTDEFAERDRQLELEAMTIEPPKRLEREEIRSQAMASLPRLTSKKHTGFAFDTPGFESFFAKQEGVDIVGRAWDVARRASAQRRRAAELSELPTMQRFPAEMRRPSRDAQPPAAVTLAAAASAAGVRSASSSRMGEGSGGGGSGQWGGGSVGGSVEWPPAAPSGGSGSGVQMGSMGRRGRDDEQDLFF
ncbi:unnamed protein product [Closterium sp. Naga37s-1]|nr:unnamed protein product [Closterium sp. Naga37s-1]